MSTLISSLIATDAEATPVARFTPLGRLAAAGTLIVGATFQVIAFATIPDFDDTVGRLRWINEHATRADVSKLFDVLAVPFLLGGAIVYVLLGRRRSPRLARAGGILLGLGMMGLMAVQGLEALEFEAAQDGRIDLAALADVVDNPSSPASIAIMFLGGATFGILVTTISLWRSRAVPRGAVLLLPSSSSSTRRCRSR
jgi:hypothetical protein